MATGLATVELTSEQIDLVRKTIAKGASDDELALFLHACKRMGLDPLTRQVYAIKRREQDEGGNWVDKMTFQTGIDGYRLIADRTGRYAPGKAPVFTYDDDGRLVSATSFVKKQTADGTWHEVAGTAYYEEYVATKRDGSPNRMWATKPHIMLGKCAEANALRRAFPNELSGVYTDDEMGQAEVVEGKPVPQALPAPATATKPKGEPERISRAQAEEVAALMREVKEDVAEFLAYFEVTRLGELTGYQYQVALNRLRTKKAAMTPASEKPANGDQKGPGRKATKLQQRHVQNLFHSAGWNDDQVAEALETRGIPSLDLMTEQQATALIEWMTEELKQVPAARVPGAEG